MLATRDIGCVLFLDDHSRCGRRAFDCYRRVSINRDVWQVRWLSDGVAQYRTMLGANIESNIAVGYKFALCAYGYWGFWVATLFEPTQSSRHVTA